MTLARNLGDTLVVFHLLGKTGWSTVVVNGTGQIPIENFHRDALVPFTRLPWKMINYRASLELVGIQDGGGNAAVVRNAILVPTALFASLSRQGLGTRNEGLWGHRILKS